ncbi:MAG: Na+ dependent nucleoside transporter N-terminal domain-containing protein [Microbacteriaceae bacterium]|nr:Na+ dependent nucleoside transporter N-terminal domain-containing protein [Microbacteriaceae bacterium]
MKLKSVIFGIVLGFGLAHFANRTPAGKRVFDRLNQIGEEICDAVREGYRGS